MNNILVFLEEHKKYFTSGIIILLFIVLITSLYVPSYPIFNIIVSSILILYFYSNLIINSLKGIPLHSELISKLKNKVEVNIVFNQAEKSLKNPKITIGNPHKHVHRWIEEILSVVRPKLRYEPYKDLLFFGFNILIIILCFTICTINFYYAGQPIMEGLKESTLTAQAMFIRYFYVTFNLMMAGNHVSIAPNGLLGNIFLLIELACGISIILGALNFLFQTVNHYSTNVRSAVKNYLENKIEK